MLYIYLVLLYYTLLDSIPYSTMALLELYLAPLHSTMALLSESTGFYLPLIHSTVVLPHSITLYGIRLLPDFYLTLPNCTMALAVSTRLYCTWHVLLN